MSDHSSFESVFSMAGGQGDASYSVNSIHQLRYADVTRPMLKDLISKTFNEKTLENNNSKVFRVVDTGCATGANTLIAAHTIVSTAIQCRKDLSLEIPEFQVFFSDLPSNDFNTLLCSLPPKISSYQISNNSNAQIVNATCNNADVIPPSRAYFASAVAGSHYHRLFPCNTLNFCHSSVSLHWLSSVPPEIEDKNSSAWNGKHIFLSNREVKLAYFRQFKEDLTSFLKCRGQEIVVGGGVFITLSGRISIEPMYTTLGRILEISLEEMVEQGIIEQNVMEKINIPLYNPSVEELRKIVEEEGSFRIIDVKIEEIVVFGDEMKDMNVEDFEKIVRLSARSVLGSFFKSHLGEDRLVDELFARVARRAAREFYDRGEVSLASEKRYVLGVSLVAKSRTTLSS